MARRAEPGSTPRAGFSPSSWARCNAAWARCTSISSARSATSASTRTWSSSTSRKPWWTERYRFLPSATYVSIPMPSKPSSGAWPGRIPRYPFLPGICKSVTNSRTKARSGVATSRESVSAMGLRLLQFRRFLDHFLDGALHVERLFGQVVVLAFDNFAEALDGIGQGDVLALVAGELLGDVEGLGEELLDFAGAGDDELVLVGELVDAENGDDVLEILVALQGALDHLGDLVVVLADDQGIEDAGGGSQRIDGGIDAEGGDIAREVGGGVEVGEGGGGSGVGVIVGGHVDGLHGGDGALVGGGDALLQFAHLGGQVGLVADGARHAAEEGGNLRAGLGGAENVVDEEEHVLAFLIAEVFGDGEAGEADAQAGAGGLGHLAVDEGAVGLFVIVDVDDAGFLDLEPQIVAFPGAFADAGEDGDPAVLHGEVVDELLNNDGLADAGATEEADLAAAEVGLDEIDDLDAGLEHFEAGGLLFEGGRGAVNGKLFLGVDGAHLVHRLADDVEHAAQRLRAHRHHDGMSEADGFHAAHQAFGGLEGDGADASLGDMLLDFADDIDGIERVEAFAGNADGGVDEGDLPFGELAVHGRTGHLDHLADDYHWDGGCHKISLLGRGGAADHFDDFLGDAALPHAVHVEREPVDHVGGVGAGRIHGGHAGGMLAGGGFGERAVEFHFDVLGKQGIEHFGRRVVEDVVHRGFLLGQLGGQNPRDGHGLGSHAFELVENEIDGVDFFGAEHLHGLLSDGGGIFVTDLGGQADIFAGDEDGALAEEVATLAADQLELDFDAGALRLEALRTLDEVGIESAGQALVGGDEHQQDALFVAPGEQRVLGHALVAGDGRGDVAQHLAQHRAVGAGADGAILRAAQFRRRDHLHGLGDLLRVFDRADAPPDIDQTRHEVVPSGSPPRSET